jgi:hypothetical protein
MRLAPSALLGVLTLAAAAASPDRVGAQRSRTVAPAQRGSNATAAPVSEFVAQLADPDPAVRAAAATSLAARRRSISDSVLAATVVPALAMALERETDRSAQAAELRLIGDIGSASAAGARAVRPALPAAISRWRQEMMRAEVEPPARTTLVRLGPAGTPEVTDAVRDVLAEQCATRPSRGMLSYPGGTDVVRRAFGVTPCTEAMLVLGAAGQAAPDESAALAAPYLSLGGADNVVAVAAARALAGFGEPGARALLAAARDRSNPDRAERGVIGLAHVLTPAAVDALTEVLRDTPEDARPSAGLSRGARLRLRAAMTLGRFGAPLATPALPALAAVANGAGPTPLRAAALTTLRAVRAGRGLPRDQPQLEDVGTFEPVGAVRTR